MHARKRKYTFSKHTHTHTHKHTHTHTHTYTHTHMHTHTHTAAHAGLSVFLCSFVPAGSNWALHCRHGHRLFASLHGNHLSAWFNV